MRLAYGELDRTLLALHNAAHPPVAKSVAIAMHTYFSSRWLSPRLTGFMVDNPEIALRIEPINVTTDLAGRDVDLAIVWSFDGPPTADAKLIYASTSYPTASPSVAQAIDEEGFDAVRQSIPLLFDSSVDQGWRHWFHLTGRHYRPSQSKLELPDTNSRVQAVIDGQGIALWDGLVQKEIDDGLLCFVSEKGLPDSGFYLVPGKNSLSRAALRFEEWLLAVAA